MPLAKVLPVKESWKLVFGQTCETELTAEPAFGVPEQGVLGPTSIPKSWKMAEALPVVAVSEVAVKRLWFGAAVVDPVRNVKPPEIRSAISTSIIKVWAGLNKNGIGRSIGTQPSTMGAGILNTGELIMVVKLVKKSRPPAPGNVVAVVWPKRNLKSEKLPAFAVVEARK